MENYRNLKNLIDEHEQEAKKEPQITKEAMVAACATEIVDAVATLQAAIEELKDSPVKESQDNIAVLTVRGSVIEHQAMEIFFAAVELETGADYEPGAMG